MKNKLSKVANSKKMQDSFDRLKKNAEQRQINDDLKFNLLRCFQVFGSLCVYLLGFGLLAYSSGWLATISVFTILVGQHWFNNFVKKYDLGDK